jgi:hypothetical protein
MVKLKGGDILIDNENVSARRHETLSDAGRGVGGDVG